MNEISGVLEEKYAHLRNILAEMGSVVIAMSGGVDSALLAKVASQVLGEAALAVTADSPSLPRRELQEAIILARQHGIRHEVIRTNEISDPRYSKNPVDRCYFCKDVLFRDLDRIALINHAGWVCFGENVDDLSDHRPGSLAAREHRVRAPLREAGLNKEEIRSLARSLELPVWEKPASACLSSRIPYGMPITSEKLAQVEAAEDFLWGAGFRQCRVRHHGEIARIEVTAEQMSALVAQSAAVYENLHQLGFTYVALDLAGYRRGSLNENIHLVPDADIGVFE